MAVIQYILTAAQSLGSQDCYKTSRMRILGLPSVFFCENEQAWTKWIPKKMLTWMLREARGGLMATVGNRVLPDCQFVQIVFLFFSVSFSQRLVFPGWLCSEAFQHILDILGLSQAEVQRTYLNLTVSATLS